MAAGILKRVFVVSDILFGAFLLVGALNAFGGPHGAPSRTGILLGLGVLSLAIGAWAAGYAVQKGLAWQQHVRTLVYLAPLVGCGIAFLPDLRRAGDDWAGEAALLAFLLANVVGFPLFLRRAGKR